MWTTVLCWDSEAVCKIPTFQTFSVNILQASKRTNLAHLNTFSFFFAWWSKTLENILWEDSKLSTFSDCVFSFSLPRNTFVSRLIIDNFVVQKAIKPYCSTSLLFNNCPIDRNSLPLNKGVNGCLTVCVFVCLSPAIRWYSGCIPPHTWRQLGLTPASSWPWSSKSTQRWIKKKHFAHMLCRRTASECKSHPYMYSF